eukprot:g22888.t1
MRMTMKKMKKMVLGEATMVMGSQVGGAALRNLAAFSRERKEQILEKEGEKVTMEALRVCRGLTEAQQPARSASALLRNLSLLKGLSSFTVPCCKEALQGHYCSDHGLPFAPFGHMLAAHPVEESSEEEAEQLDAADIKAKSPDPGVQQSSKSHIADPEMEESLARASEKVPPEMIQSMLALIQVKALRPASGDVPSSLEFQLQAVRFLWNMTFSRANQQRFMDHDGLGKVLAAMQTFQKTHHSPLQEHGCGVLRNLAHGDARHKRALLRSGVIKAVCEALRKFYQEINVCTQAVFALTALCLGAPPAALQAKKYGALRWLVSLGLHFVVKERWDHRSALKLTGDNAEITELILQALEALLLVPQALTPFGRRKGHLEVLQVLDRTLFDVAVAIARPEDTTVHMVFRTLAAALSHTNLKDMEMEKGEEPAPSGSEELWELMAKAPGTTIRNDLMDRGIIQKVIDALQKFEEYTIAIEAGAGVLMNEIALLLHRKQAASKALEYLKAYWDVPTVQASGCAFLSNLANSKLRIREAGLTALRLHGSKHQALIVQSMCKALKDLAPAEAAVQILRTYKLLDLVFEAADEHLEEPHVMEAKELNRKGTTQRALQVLQRHRAHHEVCRCGAGLLRNLFAAPLRASGEGGAKAADDCLASGGVRLLLEALWQHCLPPVQGTMSQAACSLMAFDI